MQNFSLNRKFWFFGPNLTSFKHIQWTPPLNSAYPNCSRYRILDQTYRKRVFPYKAKKVNTTDKFYNIFDLVYVPNFSLKWRLWLFWPNCPKRVFPVENRKIRHFCVRSLPLFTILNFSGDLGTNRHKGILMSPSNRRDN